MADGVSDRDKRSAVMHLLWLSLGRVSNSSAYAIIAASGPDSLAKAHHFASKRQSRRDRVNEALVYAASHRVLTEDPNRNVQMVCSEFVKSVQQDLWEPDLDVPALGDITAPGGAIYISESQFPADRCRLLLRVDVMTAIRNVLSDYESMNRRAVLRLLEQAPVPVVPVQPINIPGIEQIVEVDEPAGLNDGEAPENIERDCRYVIGLLHYLGMNEEAREVHRTGELQEAHIASVRGFPFEARDVFDMY